MAGLNYPYGEDIPKTAFDEISTAENTPVIQLLAQYSQTWQTESVNVGGGLSGISRSKFFAETPALQNTLASIISERALVYKPGQGAKGRFTAKFDDPAAGSEQDAGLLAFSDTLTFGYNGLDFGIWVRSHAEPEIRTLTINTPAAGAENASISVDGTVYIVPLTAGTTSQNAYQVMTSLNTQVQLWDFDCSGNQVIAVQNLVSESVGAFSFSSSTAAGSWVLTQAATEWSLSNGNLLFVPQANWNGDRSFQVNPQKLTPYEISFEYLGGGGIDFKIENPVLSEFKTVHTLRFAGTSDETSLRNPSFRIGWASENKANNTAIRVEGASAAGFIEGRRINVAPSRAKSNTRANVGTSPTNILTLRCRNEFGKLRNLAEAIIAITGASSDSTKPVDVQLIRNAAPASPLTFTNFNTTNSVIQISTDPVIMTGGDVIAAGEPGTLSLSQLNQTLIPGGTLSVVMNVTSGAASTMKASVIWLEDQ